MTGYKHLFQPIQLRGMVVPNRIAFPGMTIGFGVDEYGCLTQQYTSYLAERARSGAGMIILSSTLVHPPALGLLGPDRLALWQDSTMSGLAGLVETIHGYGVRLGIQLCQLPGRLAKTEEELANAARPARQLPTNDGMTKEDILVAVEAYGAAAERCVRAGFDFVEINAGYEYMLSNFLSPSRNTRTDEYGGSFENRIRVLVELVRRIRTGIPGGMPIGVKVNGDDFLPDRSWTLPEACRLAPLLEKEGVDYLHVSGGLRGAQRWVIPPMYEEQGAYAYLASEVKKHTALPVMAVVRIKRPEMADRLIRENKADLVAMGRAQIADPEMVQKARSGNAADIRPCLGDCLGCINPFYKEMKASASCTVNPEMGREHVAHRTPNAAPGNASRRVLVAGAGCAGLEAARTAAEHGYQVWLCDRRGFIGGQLRLAAMMPKRQEIGDIVSWYERQLNKMKVKMLLNTLVDAGLLEELGPDFVVVATGSIPEVPLGFIEGLNNIQNVDLMTVDEYLEDQRPVGDNVLILGGDQVSLQLADFVSERAAAVCLAGNEDLLASKMAVMDRDYLERRLRGKENVRLFNKVHKVEVLPADEIRIVREAGGEQLRNIDSIIFAGRRCPNSHLLEMASGMGIPAQSIGDAKGCQGEDQGTILAAIASGREVVSQLALS